MKKIVGIISLLVCIFSFTSLAHGILSVHAHQGTLSEQDIFKFIEREETQSENLCYKLPIIMYHSTFKKKPGQYNVPPQQLEKDFIWLKNNGYTTITVSDLIAFQEEDKPLPDKPIMLTFDDGYTNNYFYLFPLIKKYEMKCVISVIGFLTDRNYNKDTLKLEPSCAHMDYEQIKELNESGIVEIQNHTYNMHHYGGSRYGLRKKKNESVVEYEKNLAQDLKKLDEKLEKNSGVVTTAVAYPFGAYSTETASILKKLGYKASFNCCAGINDITRTSSLFNLKRNNRPYGKTSEQYFGNIFL